MYRVQFVNFAKCALMKLDADFNLQIRSIFCVVVMFLKTAILITSISANKNN